MKIIKATLNNVKDIANIEFNNDYLWNNLSLDEQIKDSKKLLLDKKERVFLINENNVFVGYISLRIENQVGDIGYLSILKDYQGKGFGSELISYVLGLGKSENYNSITLAVWENNLALKLYKKIGFKIKSERKNFYKNGDSKLYLELKL
jgi:ribosomal-protein-alanine N-acetyltransferase